MPLTAEQAAEFGHKYWRVLKRMHEMMQEKPAVPLGQLLELAAAECGFANVPENDREYILRACFRLMTGGFGGDTKA